MPAKIKSHHKKTLHHRHKPKGVSHRDFAKAHWPYIPMILIIGFLLAFGTYSGSLEAALHNPTGRVLAYATQMSKSGLLAQTNQERSAKGFESLQLNSELTVAAQAKANDMSKKNYWSHNTPDGNPPWIFVTIQGYEYEKLGENLAAGFVDEDAVVDGWMASAPHKKNLLDPSYTEVGFGFANNPDYTAANGGPMTIVVAFYGSPRSSNPKVVATAKATPPPTEHTSTESVALELEPVTTESMSNGLTLSGQTTQVQLAFAKTPVQPYVSAILTFIFFLAAGIWIGRHLVTVRKVLVRGEVFVIKHPLMDLALLTIIALSWLLSSTAGFIL